MNKKKMSWSEFFMRFIGEKLPDGMEVTKTGLLRKKKVHRYKYRVIDLSDTGSTVVGPTLCEYKDFKPVIWSAREKRLTDKLEKRVTSKLNKTCRLTKG